MGASLLNAFVWSGDLDSRWDSYIMQVKLAPNAQLSGLHWWATDIGGYFTGQYLTQEFNELLLRWYQWGAFLPLFRTHGHREPSEEDSPCGGGGGPNELVRPRGQAQHRLSEERRSVRPSDLPVRSRVSLCSGRICTASRSPS